MSAKHTPGPWSVRERNDESADDCFDLSIVADGLMDALIAQLPVHSEIATCVDEVEPHQQRANARLIACAPEMLTLIRKIDAHLVNPNALGDLIDEAEGLIAKATGGE